MHDINHCVSKALVDSQPACTLFVLEDLTGIRTATERVRLKDRYVSVSWAFYDLRKKVEYKAALAGSKSIAVDPKHTSMKCPICGYITKANRDKKKHLFCCGSCGYTSNDDRIGAMNLHNMGKNYLSAVAVEYTLRQGALSTAPRCNATAGIRHDKGGRNNSVCTTGQLQAPASNTVRC